MKQSKNPCKATNNKEVPHHQAKVYLIKSKKYDNARTTLPNNRRLSINQHITNANTNAKSNCESELKSSTASDKENQGQREKLTNHQNKKFCTNKKINLIDLRKENLYKFSTTFCHTSTIDALHYLVANPYRKQWFVFFTTVATYCFYQCILNVQMYLQYNLSTKVLEQPITTLDFPAITICPMRMFKRSKFGNMANAEFGLSAYYGNTLADNSLILENRRTCNNNNNVTDDYKQYEVSLFDLNLKNGSVWMSNEYFISYNDILLKCLWNSKTIPCGDAFMNHASDVGACFTFNPGYHIAEQTINTQTGYGINLTKYNEKNFISRQGLNGLKLFINIKQIEYCGNEKMKYGAGLFFQIHGTNRNPSFLINPSTYIMPGYDTKVVMEQSVYKRKTEYIGRCSNRVQLILSPNVTEYVIEHCYIECATVHILKSCKCYPPNLSSIHSMLLSKAKEFGSETKDVKVCEMGQDNYCLNAWKINVLSKTAMTILCPYCKQPCEETKYSTQITSLKLSPQNLAFSHFSNVSLTDLHKNYILVNFQLNMNFHQTVIEEQLYDLKDLFIYLGNNIGLYLGMSFTTIFELFYFLNNLFVTLWKNYLKNCSKRSTVHIIKKVKVVYR